MAWRTVFQRVCAALGVSGNAFLIFLIVTKSPKKLGNYKFLMIYIAVFEMLYATINGLVVPIMYCKDSGGAMLTHVEDAWLPREFLLFSIVLYGTCFGISMAIFAIHFIYRYWVVSGSSCLSNYDKKMTTAVLVFPVFFGMAWCTFSYFTFGPTPETDLFLEHFYLPPNGLSLRDVSYIGMYFYPVDASGHVHVGWRTFVGVSVTSVFVTFSFVLIFYFGYKCYCFTKSTSSTSSHSTAYQKLQSQLFYALVLQTCIPVFLMHLPSIFGFGAIFLNISNEMVGSVPSCTIALYPTLDPLPSLFVIKSYRRAIYDFCLSVFQRVTCQKKMNVQMVESIVIHRTPRRSQLSN